MAFSGSFPAKTIELGAIALAYTVEVSDVSRGVDYIEKAPLKSFLDWAVGEHIPVISPEKEFRETVTTLDYTCRDSSKALTDVGIPCDYLEKAVSKAFAEIGIPCDYLRRAVGKRIEVEAPTADFYSKGVGKAFADLGKIVDWRGGFDVVRCFKNYVVARDAPYRLITLTVRDMWFSTYYVSKGVSPAVRDPARMTDVLTKVAYRLAGFDVRRVYFHKVWGDIIEDTDQNVKIEVCKAMLEAFKRIKEKL